MSPDPSIHDERVTAENVASAKGHDNLFRAAEAMSCVVTAGGTPSVTTDAMLANSAEARLLLAGGRK